MIRLGKVAIAHRKPKLDDALQALKQQPRPTLIEDDTIDTITDLSRFLAEQRAAKIHQVSLTPDQIDTPDPSPVGLLEAFYSLDSTRKTHPTAVKDNPEKCPACKCDENAENGKTAGGKPRRRCKQCKKSWTP